MLRQPRSGRTRHPERRARRHRFHRARHLHDRGVHHGDEGARRVAGADAGRRQEHPQGLRRRRPLDPRLRDREGAPRVRPPHRLDQDVLQGGRAHRHGHRRRHAAQPARRERARAGIYVRDRHLEPRFAVLLDGERRRPDAACRPGQGQGRQQRRLRGVRRRSSGRHQACRAQGEPPHGGETRHRRQGQPRGVRPASQPRRRRIAAGRAGRGGSVDEILLILLGIAWALGTPILAIVALVRTSRLRSQNDLLRADLAALQRQMAEGAVLPPPFEVPAAEIVPPPAPPFELEPAPEPAQVAEVAPPPLPAPFPEPVPVGWEQRLGARAFLWIGAITLALAAVFLVRYSIEEGYLSPEVRVILAALFGFALIGGAERMRSRDDRVAQALAAAGVASLYGALFAAVALYEMISKVAAGGGAAALTAFAIGLSLRHGILVAGLAFVGGFVSPAIIGSETPNTPVLFGYLLAIAAGTLGVIRVRGWWPLGWGVLAGSAIWTVIWMLSAAGGLHWVGLFLVAVAGLFVWATWRRMGESENPPADVAALVWAALGVSGVLLVAIIVQDEGRQSAGWLALAAHGAGLYLLGRWTPRFQYVAVLAPVLSIAALALWWVTAAGMGGAAWGADRFAWLTILLGGFYAAGAFALLWNAARPGFWAALSVAAALAHFLLCWYVLRSLATATPWGLISIGLAVPFLVGAERLARWRQTMTGATEALGVLAAGVVFFIAAAIPLELSREWITTAYAIEFAAVAAIAARLDLLAMRQLCWPLLAVVVVRFVLNPEILKYPLGVTPVFNWILWSYGLSIAALIVGLRFLRPTGDQRLVRATEAAAALLTFVLATLEVRSVFQPGSMAAPDAGF